MNRNDFNPSGHCPTLLAAFLDFDIGFVTWTSLGPLIAHAVKKMNASVRETLTQIAIPGLSGARI